MDEKFSSCERYMTSDIELSALIEHNRKGDFSISFTGAPTGTKVTYTMTCLNFELGTFLARSSFMLPENDSNRRQYLDKADKYFNSILILCLWHLMEPEQGKYNEEPYLSIWKWCHAHKKKTIALSVFYGWDGLDDCDPADAHLSYIQPWVRRLNAEQLEEAMKRRLQCILTLFDGKISNYILMNEVLGKESLEPGDYYSNILGFKTLEPYFRWAQAINPNANFYLNENSILEGDKTPHYIQMIRLLIEAGVEVGGIGIQGHFFGKRLPPSEEMWEKLDALSIFNLPIRITEFGIQAIDERQYAEDLYRFYRLCFAHPAVEGITRCFYWEPEMWPRGKELQVHYGWRQEAPLWRKNWSPTPAAEIYQHLVTDEWVTKGSGEIDAQRQLQFRGFFGTYQFDVGGSSYTVEFTHDKQSATVTLT